MSQRRAKKLIKSPPLEIVRLQGSRDRVWTLTSMSASEKVVTGSHIFALRIFDAASGECLDVLPGHEAPVRYVLQLDEDTFVSASKTRLYAYGEYPTDLCWKLWIYDTMACPCQWRQ